MAAQRDKSAVAAEDRSILPNAAGVPWWGAVAVAVVATAIGVAFDAGAGDKELSTVFAALYVMGCVAAVLTVQQSGVFTAVIQPPLILFVSVPAAYWLFHGAGFPGLKNILINCGYPLIERFPLMLFTAATVLLIGMVRWYLGMLSGATTRDTGDTGTRSRPTLTEKLTGMVTAALNRDPAHAIEPSASRARRERRPGERPRRATAESRRAARESTSSRSRARSGERRRSANGSAPARSRQVRPPREDAPVTERPRRRRPAPELRDEPLPRRRRPAPDWDDPRRRRAEPVPRTDRDARTRGYRPSETPEPLPRRRRRPPTSNGSDTTHHPVSRVRYRRAAVDESGAQPRSRGPRSEDADSWEYDI